MSNVITPEFALTFKQIDSVQVSPDGALVAFEVSTGWIRGNSMSPTTIWVAPTDGGAARPFTGGPRADTTPRWSPDGTALAFLSDREEADHHQIYLLPRNGGEARKLTSQRGAIDGLEWSHDGRRLAFLMEDAPTDQEALRRATSDVIEVDAYPIWQRLWVLDIATGTCHCVTGEVQVWEFAWLPDGGFALLVGDNPSEDSWFTATINTVGPSGGPLRQLHYQPGKHVAVLRPSPDGTTLAFLSASWSDRGINTGDIWLLPLAGGPARNLTEGFAGGAWWLGWRDNDHIDAVGYQRGEAAIMALDVGSSTCAVRWHAQEYINEDPASRHFAPNGSVAAVRSSATTPPELWYATPAGGDLGWRQLTHIQPDISNIELGETRVLRWQSNDGWQIEGQLILPVGYQDGQQAPLVVWVHGGPASLHPHEFFGDGRFCPQIFASAGLAVFLPNPRGSVGWGVPFGEAVIGDMGGHDWHDILSGVRFLIDQGLVDRERLGIGGWSYGGFMSAWAITQTDLFRAALVGAGITHWRSFHGTASIGRWDVIAQEAYPLELAGRYDATSPLFGAARVRAHTLIVHGQNDTIVPLGQGYELYRALKDHAVPVEMVVYPGEGHGFRQYVHQLDRAKRYVEWFVRQLIG